MEIATKFAFAGSGGGQPSILVHKYTQSGQAVAGYQARREGRTLTSSRTTEEILIQLSVANIYILIYRPEHISSHHHLSDGFRPVDRFSVALI